MLSTALPQDFPITIHMFSELDDGKLVHTPIFDPSSLPAGLEPALPKWALVAPQTILLDYSSLDRVLGYGLKHEDVFQNIWGRIGQVR